MHKQLLKNKYKTKNIIINASKMSVPGN